MSDRLVAITRGLIGDPRVEGATVRMADADPKMSRAQLLEFINGASAVVTMFHDTVDAAFLDAAGPTLKGVCNYAVGHENIDIDACDARGIVVTNTPDAVTEGTANLAWALLLAVSRRVVEADTFARSDAYRLGEPLSMSAFMGRDLTGRTLLIVGAGRIGRAVALRALGFGMRVLYVSRRARPEFEQAPIAGERVELDEGLARSDVVSVHTPLTEQTRHLIDGRRLGLIKPGAILINTSRGPVVDELALARALVDGRLWGAGLDVYEFEPKISRELLGLKNVVLTPHIGSAEQRFREQMTRMVCDSAAAILHGREPAHVVGAVRVAGEQPG